MKHPVKRGTVPSIAFNRGAAFAVALANVAVCFAAAQAPAGQYECTQVALADEAQATASPQPKRHLEPATPDSSCWIEFTQVGVVEPQPTWVDVRSIPDGRTLQMPGALRIPLSDLRNKNFLKANPLVLVGSGRDDGDVALACGELKQSGFRDVRALRGGIRAWIAGGKSVLGDAAALQTVSLISPIEFQRQLSIAPWLVLGVDLPAAIDIPVAPRSYRTVDAHGDPARVITEVTRIRSEWSTQGAPARPTAIVILAADEARAMQLKDALGAGGEALDILMLQGGLEGYRSFLNQQQSIAATAGKTLARPCGSS